MTLSALRRLKPGWYVLAALTLYALVVTVLLVRAPAAQESPAASTAPAEESTAAQPVAQVGVTAPEGLWFPVPGARLPASDENLPGAPRVYRHGVSQGFDFYGDDAGVPIAFGTPVVAAADGQVVRSDAAYTEMDPRAWEVLMSDVEEAGADEAQLDRLRGRQLWLRLEDGTVLRYGHLSATRTGVRVGTNVYRGQVIGFVGNSGTDPAVSGSQDGARLRFEIWTDEGEFFGAGMQATEVRLAAATLFVGP